MFHVQFHDPRMIKWQARLARVPRWVWIALFIGMLIPVVLLLVGIAFVVVMTGVIVLAGVLLVGGILSVVHRMLHRGPRNDGRRNVQIVVRSARVIDP